MDIFCPRCDQMDASSPEDHDCIGNLERQAEILLRGITGWEDWASLSRDDLLATESRLSEIYEHMREVTAFFSKRIEDATQQRDAVYMKKQSVRTLLNAARSEIRKIMRDEE